MWTLLIGKVPSLFAVRLTLLATFLLVIVPSMVGRDSRVSAQSAVNASVPYVTTNQPLTLVSANDGRTLLQRDSRGLFDKTRVVAQDSLTVVLNWQARLKPQ